MPLRRDDLFNFLLIFSGLTVILLAAGIWWLLNVHKDEVTSELEHQKKEVARMIEGVGPILCKAKGDEWKTNLENLDGQLENLDVKLHVFKYEESSEAAFKKVRKEVQKLSPFSLVLSDTPEQPPCGVDVEWLAVVGEPETLDDPTNSWIKRGYYTLAGFVTRPEGHADSDRFSVQEDSASEEWMIIYAQASQSATSRSRLAALLWAIGLSSALLLTSAFYVLIANKPLEHLKSALDELYGTMAAQNRGSPWEIMANIQKIKPVTGSGTRSGRAAVRSFNAMHDQLKKFVALQLNWFGGCPHDLRTTIAQLQEIIDESLRDTRPRADELLEMREITKFMRAMTDDTLYLLTGEGVQKPFEKHELCSLVENAADKVEMRKNSENIRFDDCAGRIVVNARGVALERVFINLIGNALDYGDVAEISLRAEGKWAVVEIADRGPGLPKDKNVREPFVRGDTARDIRIHGSGLGLAIADDNMQSHGGKIEFLDRKGGGTIARAILPRLDS